MDGAELSSFSFGTWGDSTCKRSRTAIRTKKTGGLAAPNGTDANFYTKYEPKCVHTPYNTRNLGAKPKNGPFPLFCA
jgi:hypothetical protein